MTEIQGLENKLVNEIVWILMFKKGTEETVDLQEGRRRVKSVFIYKKSSWILGGETLR